MKKKTVQESSPSKIPRRPGTTNSGNKYEVKITALLALRCIAQKNTDDMWIGSNADNVGDFDDIVLYRKDSQGKCFVYLFQLKHQNKQNNISPDEFFKNNGSFSLSKYSSGFQKLQTALDKHNSDFIAKLRQARINLVLYTNRGVEESDCKFLKKTNESHFNFCNTSNSKNIYKFEQSALDDDYDKRFLNQLYLFVNQTNVDNANKLIEKEIRCLTESLDIDFNEITKQFITFIETWMQDTSEALTKEDIITKLTELILNKYKVDFEQFSHNNYSDKQIWNEIIRDKSFTIVDNDDTTNEFLKGFIKYEVGRPFERPGLRWDTELPKNIVKSIYKEDDKLEPLKNKFIGKHKPLTAQDIYKCLWFQRKMPLLLEARSNADLSNIKLVLELSKFPFTTLVIVNFNNSSNLLEIRGQRFVTLNDLKLEDQEKILSQACNLQGRWSVKLKDILEKSMYDIIKCGDIIKIILKTFTIGYNYESLPPHFIPRYLSKVLFVKEDLKEAGDDVFLIYHKSKTEYGINEIEVVENLSGYSTNRVIVDGEEFKKEFANSKQYAGRNLHELDSRTDGFLEYKETHGTVQNIQDLQLYDPRDFKELFEVQDMEHIWISLEDIVNSDVLKTTRIINADPEMGKSFALNYIAHNAPTTLWVMKVNLYSHINDYEELSKYNSSDNLKYFNESNMKKYKSSCFELDRAVFKKFCEEKRVLILLDGFDECLMQYNDEVTNIALGLHNAGYPVWLTTNPLMKAHLEEKFNILSTTLNYYSISDMTLLLTNYLRTFSDHKDFIMSFVPMLLEDAQKNISDYIGQFTGLPLQIMLLADVFKHKLEQDKQFDLQYLYDEFLKQKLNILHSKFGPDAIKLQKLLETQQELLALKYLIPDSLILFDIDQQLEKCFEDKELETPCLQQAGIVVVHQNFTEVPVDFNFNFVHRTFAEYVAAQWLAQNFNSKNKQISDTAKLLLGKKFNQSYPFLYYIFDRIVAKDRPLLLAIINKNVDEAKQILEREPESFKETDDCGRTVLHLIALYGARHPLFKDRDVTFYVIPDKMSEIVELIPYDDEVFKAKDTVFKINSLDFALLNRSLAVAEKLCQKSKHLQIYQYINKKEPYFEYCNNKNYKHLFKKLLPYFAYGDLLFKTIEPNKTLEEYSTKYCCFDSNSNLLNNITEIGAQTILELFKIPDGAFSDICIASAFGTKEDVCSLLSSTNINQCDRFYHAPIHYAVKHQRLEIVELLLSKEANVNISYDFSAVLQCSDFIYFNHSHILLSSNILCEPHFDLNIVADYNKIIDPFEFSLRITDTTFTKCLDSKNSTPLHLALKEDFLKIAKLLLDNGACGSIQDCKGNTSLHIAIKEGYPARLLNKDLINKAEIFYSLIEKLEIVTKMLNNGGDYNKQNEDGDTPLHLACNILEEFHDGLNDNLGNIPDNIISDVIKFYENIVDSLLDKKSEN